MLVNTNIDKNIKGLDWSKCRLGVFRGVFFL